MSRERALRRAERERRAATERGARERRRARADRRRAVGSRLREALPRRTRYRGHQGILARRRRAQNALVLGALLFAQVLTWVLSDDPWVRGTALVLAIVAAPLLVTLAFDRRS